MELKSFFLVICFAVVSVFQSYSQTYDQPNYALKSHETLIIQKVEATPEKTVISLSIENRIAGGSFCADRNIFLIESDGNKVQLKKSAGIPVCPDNYNFKSIGEILSFTLEFPPLESATKWIDIIEECTSNCFWFYGVTLDNELNRKLDEAFLLSAKGKPAENMNLFSNILDEIGSQNLGIEGLLYLNIITSAVEDADNVNAMVWYKRLAASKAPRVGEYLKFLNEKGIRY